jgi:hypothetical protein
MSLTVVPGSERFVVCPSRKEDKYRGIGGVGQDFDIAETGRILHQTRAVNERPAHLLLQSVANSKPGYDCDQTKPPYMSTTATRTGSPAARLRSKPVDCSARKVLQINGRGGNIISVPVPKNGKNELTCACAKPCPAIARISTFLPSTTTVSNFNRLFRQRIGKKSNERAVLSLWPECARNTAVSESCSPPRAIAPLTSHRASDILGAQVRGNGFATEAASGLIFYAEFCRNVIAQRKKRVRTAR